MDNWYYFNWLSGDHICEQHIHNLDVINWLMKGHPIEAQGQGGAKFEPVRTPAKSSTTTSLSSLTKVVRNSSPNVDISRIAGAASMNMLMEPKAGQIYQAARSTMQVAKSFGKPARTKTVGLRSIMTCSPPSAAVNAPTKQSTGT